MVRSIKARFDGRYIIPDEPVELPIGQALHLTVKLAKPKSPNGKPRKRKIIGLGRFRSGRSDLGSNKQHLQGFGK
jgi:hypothetical protein